MKRQLSLDLLRGIAVLLVIVRHCLTVTDPVLSTIRCGGWIGVDLFFVLSGFLVSGLLFKQHAKEGGIRPWNFLVRRGFKIYPAFWVFTAVTVASFVYCVGQIPWVKLVHEMLFVQSYYKERLWAHTWSLAVEEHFYILLALMFVPLSKVQFKPLPRIVFMTMGALLVAKCLNAMSGPFSEQQHLFPTHLRMDSLLFGVLLNYWHNNWPAFNEFCKRFSLPLIAGGVAAFVPMFIWEVDQTPLLYSVGLSTNILASGAVLMGMVCGSVPENTLTKSVAWVGKYSYSIYLWHNVAIFVIVPLIFGYTGALGCFTAMAIAVGFGALVSEVVETPMLKVREWLAA